jgi:hypothetical protein
MRRDSRVFSHVVLPPRTEFTAFLLELFFTIHHPPPTTMTMTMRATSAASAAGTSSLARASQAGAQSGVRPGRLETSSGAFEACFAGGLDLSEFGNNTSTPPTSNTTCSISNSFHFNTTATISASAALLQIRAQESVERHREEQEEFRMQAMAQKRAQSLSESTTMKNNNDDDDDKVLWAAPPKASYGTTSHKFDSNNAKTENSMLGALVGSMHGGDECLNLSKASRSKMKKDKRSQSVAKKGNKFNKQAQQQSTKGRGVVKKSKRSKY